MPRRPLLVLPFLFLLAAASLPAQTPAPKPATAPFDVKAHYTKHEFHVPMRDGVQLFTAVYAPRDTSRAYPFLMTRTCYSVAPYGEDKFPERGIGPSRSFEESGYIFVYQDVRGRFGSEGAWQEMTPHIDHPTGTQHDESTDMYDTVDWLLKNIPHNNGKVGILGISYPGFYTSASIIDSHPAIKAASPQAPVTDLYNNDDAYHNGALMFEANDFYLLFRPQQNPTPESRSAPRPVPPEPPYTSKDAYVAFQALEPLSKARAFINNPYFDETIDHPTDDPHWQERDISQHLHNIHAAVLTVGGLFDAEDLSGPWKTFNAIAAQNPQTSNQIVIGPWFHGAWSAVPGNHLGEARFGSDTGDFFREHIQLPFFEHYLKDGPDPKLAKATVYETGSNQWRSYPAWPPPSATRRMLYLQPGGKLSFNPPPAATGDAAFDHYVSDPAHPVPEVGYTAAPGPEREYMAADQRFASRRPDVLVYQTDALKDPLTFAGPLTAKLHVATSSTDSDFIVKLIDVYPDSTPQAVPAPKRRGADVDVPPTLLAGYQQLVRGEPMRGKFRHSFTKPEPFQPNQPDAVNVDMIEVNHTFLPGHRIMVQIQSTWFPLIDLNPQTFVDIPHATPADFQPATERIYHSAELPSGLEIYFLPSGAAPAIATTSNR
jgi:putative CocE/NonD family hydrolase